MSTRNVTPRANEEGEIGVVGKVWKALRAKIIEATSKMTAPTVEATSKMTAPTVEATSKMTAPTVEAGDKSKNVATTEFVKNRENMVISPFLLQRNTAYKIGDMVKVPKLGEQYILECTQAGTTGNTEPNLSTVSGGVEVNDGSVKWTVKTVTAKEYVDKKTKDNKDYINAKIKDCEQKQTVKTINVNVESQYVENMSCIQIGHVVQVSFDLKKSDESGRTALIASGLPHAVVDFIFNSTINGDGGGSVRLRMTVNGELKFHYPTLYTATQGHEFATEFTYLTND